jgi:cytochrome b561
MRSNDTNKFSSLSIGLHWLMLLLLAAVYACMELRGMFPKGSAAREAMKTWHYMLGLSVFALVWLRLAARVVYPTPAITPAPTKWQHYAALAMHIGLYALMIAMPLLGWAVLSAEGKPIPFFGLQLPPLLSANKPLAEQIMEIHETIGTLGYVLIGLHAAAALLHHYVMRDNTLRRMLPF